MDRQGGDPDKAQLIGTSELGVSSNCLLEKTSAGTESVTSASRIASLKVNQMSDYLLERSGKNIWKEVGGWELQDFSLGGWMQVSLRRVWTVWFQGGYERIELATLSYIGVWWGSGMFPFSATLESEGWWSMVVAGGGISQSICLLNFYVFSMIC